MTVSSIPSQQLYKPTSLFRRFSICWRHIVLIITRKQQILFFFLILIHACLCLRFYDSNSPPFISLVFFFNNNYVIFVVFIFQRNGFASLKGWLKFLIKPYRECKQGGVKILKHFHWLNHAHERVQQKYILL